VLAIGASTGGTKAIEAVLTGLPANVPGIVIVQHMPQNFTAPFARRLNELSSMTVREARSGDFVEPGLALLAPGGSHMVLHRTGSRYRVRIKDGPAVHYQKPSVDVLFHSVANCAGKYAAGVILIGMGADGAAGLLAMRQRGAFTVAQDERSSVVYGMPREAARMGAAAKVLPLDRIARGIIDHFAVRETV
jgi:two-component system chemotaxis response regulator CheB